MKKILEMALALVIVLSLAAYNGGNDTPTPSGGGTTDSGTQQTDPGTSQQGGENEDGKIDTSTVSGFFASYGLTEADIKPTGVGEGTIKANEYIESQAEVTYSAELDLASAIEWRDMLMSATKAAADDGKIYADVSTGKEYPTPEWVDTAVQGCTATWSYKYKGNVVIITLDADYSENSYFSIELERI